MTTHEDPPRIASGFDAQAARGSGIVGRIVALAIGLLALAAVLAVSLVLFAILFAALAVASGYLWFRTRRLRRELREAPPGGRVIEGEARREE